MIVHRFHAMGTDVDLFVDAEQADAAVAAAEYEFHRLETLMSRFREGSELSRLNREGSLRCSPDVCRVLELALEARSRTGGRFDPTVHDAVIAAGYDRSFDLLEPDGDARPAAPAATGGGVLIEECEVQLEHGVHLDLGGIGKGYAAERAAELLALAGNCLVNAGGDIAVRGGSWPVGLDTADGRLTIELTGGGLATSGSDRRRWRRSGRELHHLIDPRTGRPAESDLLRVSVVAADAIEAEVAAKALFLAGADEAAAEAAAQDLTAVLVTTGGRTLFTGALAA